MEEKIRFMHRAIEISKKGMQANQGGPFGAVIVQNGKIIAEANNEVLLTNDPTNHAEIVAIRRACKKLRSFHLENCEIYTSCEPCPMCLGAIYWAKIRKVYYANTREDAENIGFSDEFIYAEIAKPLEKRQIKFKQILHQEGLEIFSLWKAKENREMY